MSGVSGVSAMGYQLSYPALATSFSLLLFKPLVVVSFVVHDGHFGKVLGQRRRLGLPLEAGCLPGIVAGDLAVLERPDQVEDRQQVAHAQNGCARGGEDVENLELRRVSCVAPRHAQRAQDELREEGEVEADEGDHGRQLRDLFRIHAPRHLGPPEVDAGEKGHQHSAHHDEVEVGHDEVGFGEVDVGARDAQEDAGQAADGEQAHEAEGVEHGRLKGDGALVEGEGPVEYLDGRGHGNQHGEQGEDQHRVVGDAHDEHVVGPDEEAEDGDGHRGECDRRVAEDALAAEGGDHLRDNAHAGQNHDVDGGVGIEPEQMLEEQWVAALGGVEDADADGALQGDEHDGDGHDWSARP